MPPVIHQMLPHAECLRPYLNSLQRLVEENARQALLLATLNRSNAKLKQWYEKARESVAEGILVPLTCAYYGYAVEELTNLALSSIQSLLPLGVYVELQVTVGGTRPDIVLYRRKTAGASTSSCPSSSFSSLSSSSSSSWEPSPETLAWIDITSARSVDHIKDKTGVGWRKTPCVCEVIYPPLQNVSQISCGETSSIATRIHGIAAQRRTALNNQELLRYMTLHMDRALQKLQRIRLFEDLKITKPTVSRTLMEEFRITFSRNERNEAAYSLLWLYRNECPINCYECLAFLISTVYKSNQPRNMALARKYLAASYLFYLRRRGR